MAATTKTIRLDSVTRTPSEAAAVDVVADRREAETEA